MGICSSGGRSGCFYEDRSDVVLADDGSVGAGQFVVRKNAAAINRALKAAAENAGDHHDHEH
jgi:ATP-dependent protease HslVU (ClpYQ) peptidase subunit